MDDSDFLAAVREAGSTPLARLGSDKYLVAATGADLAPGPVLHTVAAAAASGRETFAAWAEEADGPAATTFAEAAETEQAHHERALDLLEAAGTSDSEPDPGDDPMHAALRSKSGAIERAGATVGRALVADRTRLQVVNFFVNEGDRGTADAVRALRRDATDQAAAGAELVETLTGGESDRERARGAAVAVIDAAYEDYAAALEGMGVDPKPVC